MSVKKAVLLINLGTPDDCTPQAVRRYLKEFLQDPRVIDIPAPLRWLLLNLFILPTRSKKSAAAYQQIWSSEGSPLLVNTEKLAKALGETLGEQYQVEYAMRYGSPSIPSVLQKLSQSTIGLLEVIPLFPQYSSAATGSAIQALMTHCLPRWNMPELHIVNDFHVHPGFVRAYSHLIQSQLNGAPMDKLIFSYHGLPERHIRKSECKIKCGHLEACPAKTELNHYCYRAQCYATSQALAKQLGISPDQYCVSFQSRLGRTPWIKPYTDHLLPELIQSGVKKIAMVCPSFVADCLETLEEVNIRTRDQWMKLGGEEFIFIPCLNAEPIWVRELADMVSK